MLDSRSMILGIIILVSFIISVIMMIWTVVIYTQLTAPTVVFNNLIVRNNLQSNFQPSNLRAANGNSLFANIANGVALKSNLPQFTTPPIVNQFSYLTATAQTLNVKNLQANNTIVQSQTQINNFIQLGTIPSITTNQLNVNQLTANTITPTTLTATTFNSSNLNANTLETQSATISTINSLQATANTATNQQLTTIQQTYQHNGNILNIGGLRIQNTNLTFTAGSQFTAPATFQSTGNLSINFTQMTISSLNPISVNTNLVLLNDTNNVDLTVSGAGAVNTSTIQGMTISSLIVDTLTCDSLTASGNSKIDALTTSNFVTGSFSSGQNLITNSNFSTPNLTLKNGTISTQITQNSIVSTGEFNLQSSQNLGILANFACQNANFTSLVSSLSVNAAGNAAFTSMSGGVISSGSLVTTTGNVRNTLKISGTLTVDRILAPGGGNLISPQTISVVGGPIQGAGIAAVRVNTDILQFTDAKLEQKLCNAIVPGK